MSEPSDTGSDTPPSSTPSTPPGARLTEAELAAESFRQAMGLTGDLRPIIKWEDGRLKEAVDEAEQALLAMASLGIYQRGSMLVRAIRQQPLTVRSLSCPDAAALSITMVTTPYLIEAMTRAADFQRFDKRAKDYVQINCPERVAVTYLARTGEWRMRKLFAAISAPTLRPDGTVSQTPGYDEATATLYDPCGVSYPQVPEYPTRDDALAALAELQWPIREFPFTDELDRSVMISLMLTALIRRSLPSAPLGAFTAPVMASGKTLLADVIAIMATGSSAPKMQFPAKDEEAEKIAISVLISGAPVILLDNIERPLEGSWLCTMITEESYTGRLLGKNENVDLPTTTLWLANGNSLSIAGDLRTRALLCRIDPRVEKPEERRFDDDLRLWMMANRPRLVAAGLTLLRAYLSQKHKPPDIHPWGRFERWSDMIRAPLIWLGLPDPCDSVEQLERDDPQRAELIQVMEAWHTSFGTNTVTVREAINEATRETESDPTVGALREALQQVALDRGALNSRRLGRWLLRYAYRICAGRQFQRAGERQGVALWRLSDVGEGAAT